MKPKPLTDEWKGVLQLWQELKDKDSSPLFVKVESVKSVVEWLKQQIFPNQKVIQWSQWQIIDLIDKAFPDLCPLGDIINAKSDKSADLPSPETAVSASPARSI